MKNVTDDSGMQADDEGCLKGQTANLCMKRQDIWFALGFKHKLSETNKDATSRNGLPRLKTICANIHVYSIQMKYTEKQYSNHAPKKKVVLRSMKHNRNSSIR